MSEFFTGVTFTDQKVTPSDDAAIRKAALADGILSGCPLSYAGSTLTMGAGLLLACGRQFRHTASQNWAVTGATSGFARLLLTIDLTRAATKETFDQVVDSIEYAASVDGFAPLQQNNVNESGSVYQMVACVVSLGTGGITGFVWKMGAAGSFSADYQLPAAAWASSPTGGFAQTITVAGLADGRPVKAYPAWPDVLAEKIALSAETAKVKACTRSGNRLTFECWEEAPVLDIPVTVEVYA